MYAVTPVPFTLTSSLLPFTPLSLNSRWPQNAPRLIPPATPKFAIPPDGPRIHPPPVTRSPEILQDGGTTAVAQPTRAVPVIVTSAFAQAFPSKVPRVKVMAAPA